MVLEQAQDRHKYFQITMQF